MIAMPESVAPVEPVRLPAVGRARTCVNRAACQPVAADGPLRGLLLKRSASCSGDCHEGATYALQRLHLPLQDRG